MWTIQSREVAFFWIARHAKIWVLPTANALDVLYGLLLHFDVQNLTGMYQQTFRSQHEQPSSRDSLHLLGELRPGPALPSVFLAPPVLIYVSSDYKYVTLPTLSLV